MYLVVIGWMYVVLMMSVAEATNTTGSVLGAIVTFFLYGLLPVALVVYLMRAPQRRKALKAREAAELREAGHTYADIARQVGSNSTTVRHSLTRLGLGVGVSLAQRVPYAESSSQAARGRATSRLLRSP